MKCRWHKKQDLQNVAWLYGACHRIVNYFEDNEELSRDCYTVGLFLEEGEVQK